jgi:hypothetical protein
MYADKNMLSSAFTGTVRQDNKPLAIVIYETHQLFSEHFTSQIVVNNDNTGSVHHELVF